jgi:predicted 3-demethylubiquinone-9 3-methyltransferase (glyoxalase superfamily)
MGRVPRAARHLSHPEVDRKPGDRRFRTALVNCDTQNEIDRYWNALLDGGTPEACGWLKDKYGLSWQIVPTRAFELMADPDTAKAKRFGEAMLKMVKFDIAALEVAASGR